jgi:hypothetical protein
VKCPISRRNWAGRFIGEEWRRAKPRQWGAKPGQLRVVRVGRRRLIAVAELERWLAESAERASADG